MQQMTLNILIYGGAGLFFMLIMTFLVIFLKRRKKRYKDFVFLLNETGFKIIGNVNLNTKEFIIKNVEGKDEAYLISSDAIFRVNEYSNGIFFKEKCPQPLKPDFSGKSLKWRFVTAENIMEIANSRHVSMVANAGEDALSKKEIWLLILLAINFLATIIILTKVFDLF